MDRNRDTGSLMDDKKNTDSIRNFLTVIFRNKKRIIVIFLAIVLIVTAVSFILPPTYEAKSALLVKFGREYIYHSEMGNEQDDRNPQPIIGEEETINSEINIIKSLDLIAKVINKIKIKNIYPELLNPPSWADDIGLSAKMTPLQAAVIKFEKNLKIEPVTKSNVIDVSFRHKDPRVAAEAVNLLVNFYKMKHLQIYSGLQSSFLERQRFFYEQKLKKAEDDLEAFKQKNGVYSLDEQRTLLLKQGIDLDTELKKTQNHIDELKRRLFSRKAQMKELAKDKNLYTQTELDRIIVEAKGKLLNLRLREQQLLQRYKPDNPLIVSTRKEIAITADFLKQQGQNITNKVKTGSPVYQEVQTDAFKTEADLTSQRARKRILILQLGRVHDEVRNLDLTGKELENLELNKSIYTRDYRTYADKVEEARISDDMNRRKMANVSVIEEAAIPAKPVRPNKVINIFVGIVLGAVSGIGYAFLSDHYSQALSTPESTEGKLGLPVLAIIPYRK